MSVRKISELPEVTYNFGENGTDYERLKNSLFEISYSNSEEKTNSYWFTSRAIKYDSLLNSLMYNLVGDENNSPPWNFYTDAHFMRLVYMHAGLELSGDFYVNKETQPAQSIDFYKTVMRSGNTTIYSKNETNLSAGGNVVVNATSFTVNKKGSSTEKYIQCEDNVVTFGANIAGTNGTVNVQSMLAANDVNVGGTMNCTGVATFQEAIQGCAVCALWADLAEGYESDSEYEPGTFVRFGGDKEITVADVSCANAVITTKPGFILGSANQSKCLQNIALVGRTPVRVVGRVRKFDRLVMSDIPGVARSMTRDDVDRQVVAIALERTDADGTGNDEVRLVESVVQLRL